MWLLSRGGAAVPLFLYLLHSVSGGYIITWPKTWFSDTPVQFCIAREGFLRQSDEITVQISVPKSRVESPTYRYFEYPGGTAYLPDEVMERLDLEQEAREVILQQQVRPTSGARLSCTSILPPYLLYRTEVRVNGTLGGVSIDQTRNIDYGRVYQTFIQTDKNQYKPGEKVQFRSLTLETPSMRASTDEYNSIFVSDPAGRHIQNWLKLPNPTGLIHLEFQLDDEALEGDYTIYVSASKGSSASGFIVAEYVLPKFEVTYTAPGYILRSDETLEFEICAMYTFGEPVSGTLAINIKADKYTTGAREVNIIDKLTGCKPVELSLNPLFNDLEDYVFYLSITVAVTEEGTDVVATQDFSVNVEWKALYFEEDSSKYPRLELPYFSSLRVRYNDGKPANNEPMTVCSKRWVLPIEAQRMRQLTGCATVPPSNTQNSPMTLCPEIVCQYVGTDNDGIPKTACFLSLCRNITTDDAGVLHVTIPPHLFSEPLAEARVEVKAVNYPDLFNPSTRQTYMNQPTTRIYIGMKPYYSPSNSTLYINPDNLELDCTSGRNIEVQLPVMYAATGSAQITLYVQVVSRGQIQLWKTQDVVLSGSNIALDDATLIEPMMPPTRNIRRGVFTIPLSLPPSVSPTVRVLIWYTRQDGEVVSDEQELKVSKCLNYNVELSWPSERADVGAELPLTLTTEPRALCSLGVVDKSVELLSSPVTLFIDEIFWLARSADYPSRVSQIDDFKHCIKRGYEDDVRRADRSGAQSRQQPQSRMIDSDSSYAKPSSAFYTDHVDAIKLFDDAGLIVISDLTLETRPCRIERNGGRGGCYGPYSDYVQDLLANAMISDSQVLDILGGAGLSGDGGDTSGTFASALEVNTRVHFPETWLWELQTIPDSGVYSSYRTLPDTITEWVGRAVCVHPDKGVGISDPTSITTFRPFFVDLNLPPSVKMGEILPLKISVFNYFDTSVSVRVTVEESSEYEILGTSGTEAAADQATAGVRSACVPSDDKETVIVRIRFLEAGPVNITVSAEVVPGLVTSCGSGAPTNGRDRIITPINVDYEGFVRETFHSLYYCTNSTTKYDEWTLTAPPVANIVDSSVRAWITATGDLIGPNLQNLDWLIRMPYGCGEQNLAKFAPNVYILQYLQRSRQYNATVANTLIEYMNRGYQQQLNYRRSDGSYSVFGSRDQYGSTWLTAFVLKTYAQARMYIKIDPSAVSSSADWLLSLQLPSGCFQLVGYVHNTRMKGGLGEGSTPGALTAYVMAALLEGGKPTDSEQIANATACVEAATAAGAIGENDVYLLALKAYAFSLAGLPQTADVIDDLLTRAEENSDGTFWEIQSHSGWFSASLSVETTSYVLLAMLKSNYPDPQGRKLRLLKWILSRRNGYGGFVSTQDTVIGLQALALFGSPVPNEPFDAEVTFSWNSVVKTLQVTEDNKRLLQRFNVEPIPAQIDVEFSGDGCIFVESVVRYNVKDPDVSQVFTLSVFTNIDYYAAICQSSIVRVCATYDPINIESNMAIIEVNLVSGYLPDIQDLERIVSDVTGSIKRYEVDGSQVIFYVDQFGDSQICVEFTAFEDTEIELTAPGTVRVYDYYEPDFYVSEVFRFSRRYCS